MMIAQKKLEGLGIFQEGLDQVLVVLFMERDAEIEQDGYTFEEQ